MRSLVEQKFYFSVVLLSVVIFLIYNSAQAYPEFIAARYPRCISCHNNGTGGGALSDFGKNIFKNELIFTSSKKENTGALNGLSQEVENRPTTVEANNLKAEDVEPKNKNPWNWEPSFKYLGLWKEDNPRSNSTKDKFYHMQIDGNLVVSNFDESILLSGTWGSVPTQEMIDDGKYNRILSKDYFIRYRLDESLFLYFGLIEKTFGIRLADHTIYTRSQTGLNYNSQEQSLLIQSFTDCWDWALQFYWGNPYEIDSLKNKGASFTAEKNISELNRVGLSLLSEKNDNLQHGLFSMHWRYGFEDGSSVLLEYGLQNSIINFPDQNLIGDFGFIQSKLFLDRGKYLKFGLDKYNTDLKIGGVDHWRFLTGFTLYPLSYLEMGMDILQERIVSVTDIKDDIWSVRGYFHVAF